MSWSRGAWIGGLAEWVDEEQRTAYLRYAPFDEYEGSIKSRSAERYDHQQGLFT